MRHKGRMARSNAFVRRRTRNQERQIPMISNKICKTLFMISSGLYQLFGGFVVGADKVRFMCRRAADFAIPIVL